MITESITVQGLHVISLALTPTEKWGAAGGSFSISSATEWWLAVLAVVALIISVILLFWVFARYGRTLHSLNQNISELTATNIKLQQENNELTATNEKLRQEKFILDRARY